MSEIFLKILAFIFKCAILYKEILQKLIEILKIKQLGENNEQN